MADSDTVRSTVPTVVPRGRHAPPLEVRLTVQRRRLFEAAAKIFAQRGFADATAEAISREAGMSKATFYEHFANKEEAILALFDEAATEVMRQMALASETEADTYPEHLANGTRAFLRTLAEWPDASQTVLVEIIGAGPRATERRDAILDAFADAIHRDNERIAPRYGAPRFASRDDAFACVGAIVELASRQLRTGNPGDIRELEPVIERLMLGILQQAGKTRQRLARTERMSGRRRISRPWRPRSRTCRRCPRLVAWREQVAREKRASFTGRHLLGPPDPGLRRPGRPRPDPRPRARRPRRQPHRPRLHRRPQRGLPLRRAAPHGLREPADVGVARRRARS